MFFKKKKETYLSIYQVEKMTVNGLDLESYNQRKGKFGDTVIDLEAGTYTVSGIFIMTKGKENQLSDEMSFEITIEAGKNVFSVPDKEKHFTVATPIAKPFEANGEHIPFFVGILK